MKKNKEIFSQRLYESRIRAGMSQRELALKVAIGYSAISLYESGKRMPNKEILRALAHTLSVSVSYLIGLSTDISDENSLIEKQNEIDQLKSSIEYRDYLDSEKGYMPSYKQRFIDETAMRLIACPDVMDARTAWAIAKELWDARPKEADA